ncbi:hypothetical protein ABZP36_005615 [Zizania latifolia]
MEEEKKPAAAEGREEEKVAAAEEVTAGREEEEAAPAVVLKKGPWTSAEDAVLVQHVRQHGEGNWNAVQRVTGLLRCGKSCRLRWTNHLRPNLKKGSFSPDEEFLVAQLHAQLGNKWARISSHVSEILVLFELSSSSIDMSFSSRVVDAIRVLWLRMSAQLPGRTDNEIKNYWNTRTKRRQRAGLPVYPPEVQLHLAYSKRCRYDGFSPLSSQQQPGSHVLCLDEGDAAASARYTSARPPPLDLAGHLTMGSRPVQFLAPTPFSAPSSPWGKPFARNAQFFQLPHSSPVSPTTPNVPVHAVTPKLSSGYGLHGGDHTRLPPMSPSSGARVELPSSQLRPAMPPVAAALSGTAPNDPPNQASFEAMLQELHDAIKIDPPAQQNREKERDVSAAAAGGGGGDRHGVRGDSKPDVELKDDTVMETLFDLIMPATFSAALEPSAAATAAAAPNHSGSVSQHSSDDQGNSSVDVGLGVDLLPALAGSTGGPSSSEQDEWSVVDGAAGQWNNISGIC